MVTKKGTWKLAGFEFIERANENDAVEPVVCQPWSSRLSKMAQPNLDFMGKFWKKAESFYDSFLYILVSNFKKDKTSVIVLEYA